MAKTIVGSGAMYCQVINGTWDLKDNKNNFQSQEEVQDFLDANPSEPSQFVLVQVVDFGDEVED